MWNTVNNMKENSVKIIAFVGMSGSGFYDREGVSEGVFRGDDL